LARTYRQLDLDLGALHDLCLALTERFRLRYLRVLADPDGVDGPHRQQCATAWIEGICRKEPRAMSIAMIGLDTAKMVCSQRTNSA